MEEVKKQMETVLDGFFYLFGFTDNPADKPSKEILRKTPAQKIKQDIRRVNASYRQEFDKVRKEVMCLGE